MVSKRKIRKQTKLDDKRDAAAGERYDDRRRAKVDLDHNRLRDRQERKDVK